MNIRDLNPGLNRARALNQRAAEGPADAGLPARPGAAAPEAGSDRVELSHTARSQAASPEAQRELDVARKALREAATLGTERADAIRARLDAGFYDDPQVLREVATRLAGEAGSPDPP